jgi:predicted lipid-binding transport protein (Tim44 family)
MADGYSYLEIVVFAVIAGLLILRLRSVLGRRTGTERRRDPFEPGPGPEKVVPLPARSRTVPPSPTAAPASVAAGIARIGSADRAFDENGFLVGARAAFEIVVNAFAKGDTAALQPLLSESVYASFSEAIRARLAAHETFENNLLSIKSVEIAEANLEGDVATVTVRVISDQTSVTRAADGSVVDGNPDQVEEKTDLWTFSRSVRARDPNWTLVATHSP